MLEDLLNTRRFAVLLLFSVLSAPASIVQAQPYSRADSLRGSTVALERTWWDVLHYDLRVDISPADSSIAGSNRVTYRVVSPSREMQIDLQAPMEIDSVVQDGVSIPVRRDGNAYFVTPGPSQTVGSVREVTVHYHGRPPIAPRPPWDGGFTWGQDEMGRPWVATTDEGVGPSIWWPLKDTWADEPDSASMALTLPDPMVHVGSGRLRSVTPNQDGTTTWEWAVTNPINLYALNVAAGSYAHYTEFYEGESGTLTMDFWPLDYNLENAKRQFPQAITTMQCFEHWFGPYPWYEDGYKLIEVSNLGMEHQSAVTYGNGYANGYLGRDLSGTGLGLEWDFIIVHESAHEWWANNITAKDHADMWVHESFANYAEGLYTECLLGKEAGAEYIIGNRDGIQNDRPIIPEYGVSGSGSGDMYPKGGNMLHAIRQIVNDDEKWRGILRGLNETFWHQTVMGFEVEEYISREVGVDLEKMFDQYLRTASIPVFEYQREGATLRYRWVDAVPGFDMQVGVTLAPGEFSVLHPTEDWQEIGVRLPAGAEVSVDPNYYVETRSAGAPTTRSPVR